MALLTGATVLLLGGVASAQQQVSDVGRAVSSLSTDPVYVDQDAGNLLSPAGADKLREQIRKSGTPIYLAVLPQSAAQGTTSGTLLRQIAEQLDRRGTYALVVGDAFRAGNTVTEGIAGELATEAFEAKGDQGVEAVLTDFVNRVSEHRDGNSGTLRESSNAGVVLGVMAALLLLVGGVGGLLVWRGAKRRREIERRQFADVQVAARDDLVALGEDIRALDLDVSMPDADPKAVEAYTAALDRYEEASRTFDRAQRVPDLAPVTKSLEEGRFNMATAKALLAGEPAPERRGPCFFDPRHGPSVADVTWTPEGGAPREVPACAADAQRVRDGLDPATKQVLVNGTPVPYYNAPGHFGPYAGGYFGDASSGLLTGLLIGSLLTPGWGWGGYGYGYGGYGGDGGSGDGGDFGGGDFGGGFGGGGDFGGGDFGGDFGG